MSEDNVPETPAPSGGGKLVPLLLLVNTGLMGGVLFLVLRKPVAPAAASVAAPAAEKSAQPGGKEAAPKPGVMVRLENFVIQLKAIDADRYVRVAFDLEVPTEEDKTVLVPHISQVRDAVISYFSDRTIEELRGSEGMERTKAALLRRFDEIVPGRRIKAVYVTEFIVQ